MNLSHHDRGTLDMLHRNKFLSVDELLRAGVPWGTVKRLESLGLIAYHDRQGVYRLTDAGKEARA